MVGVLAISGLPGTEDYDLAVEALNEGGLAPAQASGLYGCHTHGVQKGRVGS